MQSELKAPPRGLCPVGLAKGSSRAFYSTWQIASFSSLRTPSVGLHPEGQYAQNKPIFLTLFYRCCKKEKGDFLRGYKEKYAFSSMRAHRNTKWRFLWKCWRSYLQHFHDIFKNSKQL